MRSSLASTTPDLGAAPKVLGYNAAGTATVADNPSTRIFLGHAAPTESRRLKPREWAYRVTSLVLLGDAIVACLAIFAALTLREWQRLGMETALATPAVEPYIAVWSLAGGAVFMWLMMLFGTYEVGNLYRINRALKNGAKASVLWAVGNWAVIGFFQLQDFTPRIGALYCIASLSLAIGLWRLVAFAFLINPAVKERASARVLVVGWSDTAGNLRRAMRMDLGQLSEIVGCVPMPGGRFATKPPGDVAVLGDYSSLPAIVRDLQVDSIVLADVSCPSAEIQNLIAYCQRELVSFRMVPQYFPALRSGLQVTTLSGVPLLGVTQLPLDRTLNRVVKRAIDIVGALCGLAVSGLIIPFFCLLVYLESPGPVIFKQRRTSRSGRDFYIYKIRSMRLNAETGTGAVWCKQDDPRRLKVGSFMRKTNIDELPQFWNVLKGDMSLVGPRPERPELIAKFKDEIPNYNARHEVRAGLTGWAQINGLRGDTDLHKRIEADLYYLENWSVTLDLYCIFATFFKVKNAY